ncbi:MAG: hypothetical protein RL318_2408 [Fibrobacterota bacterium]|jgi:hypothetical protein
MRFPSILAAFSFACLASLMACDPEEVSSLGSTPEARSGSVAFRLSSADSLAVSGSVDSVLVQAHSSYGATEARGTFGSALTLSNLPAGQWVLHATLFNKAGAIRWAGCDTFEVKPGEETRATLRLFRTSGSIRVDVVIDSTPKVDSSFVTYVTTFKPVYPARRTWMLDAQGNVTLISTTMGAYGDSSDTSHTKLNDSTLAWAKGLLESATIRRPIAPPPAQRGMDTIYNASGDSIRIIPIFFVGGATIDRRVSYANASSSFMSLNWNIQQPSASWTALDTLDNLLESLLKP